MKQTPYSESQKINKWIIIFLITISLCRIIYLWSDLTASDHNTVPIMETCVLMVVNALFWSIRLTIEIKDKTLYYKLFPFHWDLKSIKTSDIESATEEKINVFFWGLGLRHNILHNIRGYIVAGGLGLKLVLKGGQKILFSTFNASQFIELIIIRLSK